MGKSRVPFSVHQSVILFCARALRHKLVVIAIIVAIVYIIQQSTPHSEIHSSPLSLFSSEAETLCVAILTSATSYERRKVARETWITLDDGVRVFFSVGLQDLPPHHLELLDNEQKTYGDLITLSMIDSYANLTLKLLETIKYLVEKQNCKFILKADDDSFIRIDLIVSELERVKVEDRLYWGYFTGRAPVFRKGKWAEKEWFLCDKYLPYARGGGYIFSIAIARIIAHNAPMLQLYASEDVSFGVWTSALKVHRVHDVRFDTEYQSRGCLNSFLISHKQSIEVMREKIRNFRSTGSICGPTGESTNRKAYTYNWTVPASQCCDAKN